MATVTEPVDVLLQAIVAKWAETPALNDNIPGPWRGEKPANTQANPASGTHYPYCVIPAGPAGARGSLTTFTCGNEYWRIIVPFYLYDETPEACRLLVAAVDTVFRSSALSLSLAAGSLVKHRRIDQQYSQLETRVWRAEVIYQFETSWPRA